jgi:hypothetical protein
MINEEAAIQPVPGVEYRTPVVLAACGLLALAFATGAATVYVALKETPGLELGEWLPLVSALASGGFWISGAAGFFALAFMKSRSILRSPREEFGYSSPLTWLLIVGGVLVLAKNVWWLAVMPPSAWATLYGAVRIMFIAFSTMIAVWCFWTARLRTDRSGFGRPATIAAMIFLAFGLLPWAVVTLVAYLIVRKKEGMVIDGSDRLGAIR